MKNIIPPGKEWFQIYIHWKYSVKYVKKKIVEIKGEIDKSKMTMFLYGMLLVF